MKAHDARKLLGLSPNYRPTLSQVKEAYRRKALESHPDLFPVHEKSQAESRFKMISEAYTCLQAGAKPGSPLQSNNVRVVRTGAPTAQGKSNHFLVKVPFVLLILGTISFGGLNASRAYQRQKETYPSHNPFLP